MPRHAKTNAGTAEVARLTLSLPVTFQQEGNWIVASFPHLDLSSQGHTHKEAESNLIEAAQLFLEDCLERGVLGEVLQECGFTVSHGAIPPATAGDHLTVPVDLLAARHGHQPQAG